MDYYSDLFKHLGYDSGVPDSNGNYEDLGLDFESLLPGENSTGTGTGSTGNDTGFDYTDLFKGGGSGNESTNGTGLEARTEPLNIPLNVFRLLICVVGIIGNLLVITVILILKEYKKTITHWYVLQLATADTLFLLCIPFRVAEDINDGWEFAAWLCKAKETILFLNYYSSVLFLIVMSVDRYIAVCHGFSDKIQKLRTPTSAMIIAGAVWIVSLLLCIPVMLYSGLSGIEPKCKCQYQFPVPFDAERQCLREKYVKGTEDFDKCIGLQIKHHKDSASCIAEPSMDESDMEDFKGMAGSGQSLTDFLEYLGGHESLFEQEITNSDAPASLVASVDDGLNPGCHYYEQGEGFKTFIYFNFTVMFLLPILVMTICYTMIIVKLNKTKSGADSCSGPYSNIGSNTAATSGRRSRTKSNVSTGSNDKSHKRVNIMCAALVSLFIICWIPYHSVHLAKFVGIKGSSHYCGMLFKVASLFFNINSAINPYLCLFIGTRFVKRMRSAVSNVRKPATTTDGVNSSHGATEMSKLKEGDAEKDIKDGLSSNIVAEEYHEEN